MSQLRWDNIYKEEVYRPFSFIEFWQNRLWSDSVIRSPMHFSSNYLVSGYKQCSADIYTNYDQRKL